MYQDIKHSSLRTDQKVEITHDMKSGIAGKRIKTLVVVVTSISSTYYNNAVNTYIYTSSVHAVCSLEKNEL